MRRAAALLFPALLPLALLAACGGLPGAVDTPAVAPDTVLPFGQVGEACGLGRRELGGAVDKGAGLTLHDTAPGSTASRSFYIAGMEGCPLQVTGALALFGTPAAYEATAYGVGGPRGATDSAYGAIAGQVCGVRAGTPCPAAGLERLERDTAFVTVYPGLGADTWLELLIHEGKLVAQAVKSR